MRHGGYGAVLALVAGALIFTAVASAGNPHGSPPAQAKASAHAGASVHANAQKTARAGGSAHARARVSMSSHGRARAQTHARTAAHAGGAVGAHVQARTSSKAGGAAHVRAAVTTQATMRAGAHASVTTQTQAGVKPSSTTGFNRSAPASSSLTKLYGNGMTAGQIAQQAGFGSAMLFGPGNSQPHKALCGVHMVDVHALKAHATRCALGTSTSASVGVHAGVKPSAATRFDVGASASSNLTKLYGNGTTAGQIAAQAGLGNAVLFGPGNSQPHKVACGSKLVDVHALKANAGACAALTAAASVAASAPTAVTSQAAAHAAGKAHGGVVVAAAAKGRAGVAAAKGRTSFIVAKGHARGGVAGASASARQSASGPSSLVSAARTGTLPFTGLALGLPLALALLLIGGGLGIRHAARPTR